MESKDREHAIVCWNCGEKGHIVQPTSLVETIEVLVPGIGRDNIVGGLEAEAISTDYRGASLVETIEVPMQSFTEPKN